MSQCCFCGCPHPCTSKYAELFYPNQLINRCALLRLIQNLKEGRNQNNAVVVPNHQNNNTEQTLLLLTGPEILRELNPFMDPSIDLLPASIKPFDM